jgi:hypothetical protein
MAWAWLFACGLRGFQVMLLPFGADAPTVLLGA